MIHNHYIYTLYSSISYAVIMQTHYSEIQFYFTKNSISPRNSIYFSRNSFP